MKGCLILANGQVPKKKEILHLQKIGYKELICADGGANTAYKLSLIPDIIIGDLDSIETEVLEFYVKESIPVKKIKRQNDTDVEKCLKYAIQKKYTNVILLGATGNRLDHSFCNLGISLKFDSRIKVDIIYEKSFLRVYSGKVELDTFSGETISLYGFDNKTKFNSSGLKYPLKDISLPFGERESTSNVALSDNISLNIKNGSGFIIRDYEVVKTNGFIHVV